MKKLYPFMACLFAPAAVLAAPDISTCRALTDDAARIACYDELIDGQPADVAPAPTAEPAAPVAAPKPAQPPAEPAAARPAPALREPVRPVGPTHEDLVMAFGAELLPAERRPPIMPGQRLDEVSMLVTKFLVNPLGKTTIWFDNGHVWRQTTSGDLRLHRLGDPPFIVRIERGVFNSFRIHNDRSKTSVVAKRIR